MIKYLGWKWYDWVISMLLVPWIFVVTVVMAPLIVAEYMIYAGRRTIRENRFYERHDFGQFEDPTEDLDDFDRQVLKEMFETHVIGKFLYKSKMMRIWGSMISFTKNWELR